MKWWYTISALAVIFLAKVNEKFSLTKKLLWLYSSKLT